MTDNTEKTTCFMCDEVDDCTLIPQSNVWLCEPCVDDILEINLDLLRNLEMF